MPDFGWNGIAGWLLLVPGSLFCLIGGFGLVRLPDVYARLHAAGVIDTLAAAMILVGLMFIPAHWTVAVKLVGILFFLYVTSSTATHAVANAAWSSGIEPVLADDAPPLEEPAP